CLIISLSHRNEIPPFFSLITVKGEFTMAHSLTQFANYFVHQPDAPLTDIPFPVMSVKNSRHIGRQQNKLIFILNQNTYSNEK
ncbi:MAG: hypothetical protein WBI18_03240, partial [Candidatus Saccharicenans sp.]